jgi:antitoxin MazE
MKVAKWGNSLAIRLPAAVVEALRLKEGDEIEIHVAGARELGVARKPSREAFLNQLRAYRPGGTECPVVSSTRISLSLSRLMMRQGRAPTQSPQLSLTDEPDNADRNVYL